MNTSSYEAPALSVVGSIADVTQALGQGAYTDADFPEKTPKDDLTFSG